MTASHTAVTPRQLSHAWRDWTEVIRMFADKVSAREQVKENVYREIHQSLTASLSGLVEQQQSPMDADLGDFYDQLLTLVQPWMSLTALRDADQRFTQNLLGQCQRYQREIDTQAGSSGERVPRTEPVSNGDIEIVRPLARSQSAWGTVGLLSLVFVGMLGVGLGSEFWPESWSESNLTIGTARHSVLWDDSQVRKWLLSGIVTVVTGCTAWAVFRGPRSY